MRWVPEDLPLIFNLGSRAYERASNRRCSDAVCAQRFERAGVRSSPWRDAGGQIDMEGLFHFCGAEG